MEILRFTRRLAAKAIFPSRSNGVDSRSCSNSSRLRVHQGPPQMGSIRSAVSCGVPIFLGAGSDRVLSAVPQGFLPESPQGRRAWTDADSLELSIAIASNFIKAAKADGNRVVILMIPTAPQVAKNVRPYAMFMSRVRNVSPTTCIVDPFEALRKRYNRLGNLSAPKGHFKGKANEAIAAAIVEGLRQCHLTNEGVQLMPD
jgi:hypothetical protein